MNWSSEERSVDAANNRRSAGGEARRPRGHANDRHQNAHAIIGEYNGNDLAKKSNYRDSRRLNQSRKHNYTALNDRLFEIAGYGEHHGVHQHRDILPQAARLLSKTKSQGRYRQKSPSQNSNGDVQTVQTVQIRHSSSYNNESDNFHHPSVRMGQISCPINSIEVKVVNPALALDDVRATVLSKIKSIDNGAILASVTEDCIRPGNRFYIFILRLSTCLNLSQLEKMSLPREWSVRAFYDPTISSRNSKASEVPTNRRV